MVIWLTDLSKMKEILNRRFWIINITLNAAMMMMYLAFSFIRYDLALGHIVGIISFCLFLTSIYLPIKVIASKKPQKQITKVRTLGVVLFLIIEFCNFLVIILFAIFNYLFKLKYGWNNVGQQPFNIFTIVSPYLIFMIQSITTVLVEYFKNKKNLGKGGYGQNTQT